MKFNGVKHIRVAPYNVASNGTGERMVQSFKNHIIVLCATQIMKGFEESKRGKGRGLDELWPYPFLYWGRGIPGAKSDVRLRKE